MKTIYLNKRLTTIASITWSGHTVFLFFAPHTLFALAASVVRKVMHSWIIISFEFVLIRASLGSFSMISWFTVAEQNQIVKSTSFNLGMPILRIKTLQIANFGNIKSTSPKKCKPIRAFKNQNFLYDGIHQ